MIYLVCHGLWSYSSFTKFGVSWFFILKFIFLVSFIKRNHQEFVGSPHFSHSFFLISYTTIRKIKTEEKKKGLFWWKYLLIWGEFEQPRTWMDRRDRWPPKALLEITPSIDEDLGENETWIPFGNRGAYGHWKNCKDFVRYLEKTGIYNYSCWKSRYV